MYQDRIVLTSEEILNKVFKIDTRGYRPQEVDRFLDTIIKDYEEMNAIIRELDQDKKDLLEDNIRLKQEIRNLKTKIDVITEESNSGASGANADLLRRISNLEKIIYGKE
ncbi:MAG: DivIVA domain-containing protein [Bacilli bacterium]|nr:DivIVA domain-containing protein [Bacilli bacterium]